MTYNYTINGILVEIVNPPACMGKSHGELNGAAETWASYAENICKPNKAASVQVLCNENGVIRPSVVACVYAPVEASQPHQRPIQGDSIQE